MKHSLVSRGLLRISGIPGQLARTRPLDLASFPASTTLVTGSGRSGTTWLAELLLANRPARYMFEPFHPFRSKESGILGGRRYIPPETRDAGLEAQLEKILRGGIHNPWVNRLNRRVLSRHRLIKCIRVNLMLRWIHRLHPDLKIIYIIRHPLAMANSYTELNMRPPMEEYLRQPDLIRDYLAGMEKRFREPGSPLFAHLLRWAVEQVVALDGLVPNEGLHILFYENLCIHPGIELRRLGEFLRRPPGEAMFRALNRPSSMSHAGSAIHTGKDRVLRWRDNISYEQETFANDLLSRLGLDKLYEKNGMPATQPGTSPEPYVFPG